MTTDSQDVGEPFFIIFIGVPLYALIANVLYTTGWVREADGNAVGASPTEFVGISTSFPSLTAFASARIFVR